MPMTNAERLELRQRRMAAAPAFLQGGYRPFFLGSAIWACVAIGVWLWAQETAPMRIGAFDPLTWHRHEMMFGFVGAAIAGFALTAVPNWTGRLPIAGAPLAGLALWWLGARLLPLFISDLPLALLGFIDGSFYIGLALLILREILLAKNRNVPIALILALMGLADWLDYAGAIGLVAPQLGIHFALGITIILVSLIGGRIIPSFTRNWLQKEKRGEPFPAQTGPFDLATIAMTGIAFAIWIFTDIGKYSGILLLAAGVMHALRLSRWQGRRCLASPIVLVLHLAYAWIPLGLLLLAAAQFGAPIATSAGIHALAVGAMAGMIAAVMTRATLGHTGRALHADFATIAFYMAIQFAALTRVWASFDYEHYQLLIRVAGGLWITAFALFTLAYGPKLLRPKPGR